jgi:hypothetical protein
LRQLSTANFSAPRNTQPLQTALFFDGEADGRFFNGTSGTEATMILKALEDEIHGCWRACTDEMGAIAGVGNQVYI